MENFFRSSDYEKKYVKPIINRIISDGLLTHIPILRIKLIDLDDELRNLFKKDPTKFLTEIQNGLYNIITFNLEIKEIFEKYSITREDLHIIPDPTNLEILVPEIEDFSIDLTKFVGKIIRIIGRSQNTALETRVEWKTMIYQCKICSATFESIDPFHQIGEKYDTPTRCTNPRCKASLKRDFRFLEDKSESYEIRYFTIADRDLNHALNEKECIILQNISYFVEKMKHTILEGDVEVLGILRRDATDLFKFRRDEQSFSYYIKVLDMKPKESNRINNEMIKNLRSKLKKDPDYREELIDSIHSYSSRIFEYFIVKLIMCITYITGDSWWLNGKKRKSRNTINSIIGGHTGTLKSSIVGELKDILGNINFGIIYAQDTTNIGLIPTVQRSNRKDKDLVKRLGILRYYHRKTVVIDESQYLNEKGWRSHKYLENGFISRGLDGTTINEPCEGSVIHLRNYKGNKNECYDYSKSLHKNLGEIIEKEPSHLERFDLHYAIPPITKRIEKILGKRDVKSLKENHTMEELFNYLTEAKRIYPEVKISLELNNVIEKLKNAILDSKKENKIRSPRNLHILTKLVKAISALNLKEDADYSDLEFLKEYLIDAMIPFYDIQIVKHQKSINIRKIFNRTFSLLQELFIHIPISDHINFIREFLRSHFFQYPDPDIKDPAITRKINEYMPSATNKSNHKYRDLIEDTEIIKSVEKSGYVIGKIGKKTHFIKLKILNNEILGEIHKISIDNDNNSLEIMSLVQILEINTNYDKETVMKSIDFHIQNQNLMKIGNNQIKILK